MKISRCLLSWLVLALVAPSMFAALPQRWEEWNQTPESYFMTRAERAEWSGVRSREQAEQFVAAYLARRGPEFPAMVADRTAQADKHLTIGKLLGSLTLRGKMIVVFGPPSAVDITQSVDKSDVHHDSPEMTEAMTGGAGSGDSGGGRGGGAGSSSEVQTGNLGMTEGAQRVIRFYHLTFASTPAGPIDTTIVVDPMTGRDHPRTRSEGRDLDAAFEAGAIASIRAK